MTSSYPSFASWDMTRTTFSQLLASYPTTLRESCKRKLLASATRRHRKHPERLDRDDPVFDEQADAVVELDRWRFETLPRTVRERRVKQLQQKQEEDEEEEGKEEGKKNGSQALITPEEHDGIFMLKDETIKLLDWKLRRGQFRPQLSGMIKTNKPDVVRKTTAEAYKAVVDKRPSREAIDETFPKQSLDTLTGPLRAVGPAMASLILAVGTEGTANEIPFYSDELYLWLCVDWFPCSEKNRSNHATAARIVRKDGSGLNLRYNMLEYRQLYEEVVKVRERINSDVEKEKSKGSSADGKEADDCRDFTAADIDRVAYVLQHLAASDFPNAAEIVEKDKESKMKAEERNREEEQEEEETLGESKPAQAGKKRKPDTNKRGKTKKVKT